jgi:hypothetical protein
MDEELDTPTGGESLSIEQAAAAFVKASTPDEADTSQSEVEDEDEAATTDDELQASDEDVSEETDGETDDEEGQAEETDDAEEPETEGGRIVAHDGRVKLPDGSWSTVGELIQGNLRDRDYRQKTMEAAEVRKAAEAQSAAIKASEEQLNQMREYNISLIKSILPPQPDPSKADPRSPNYDPAGYQAEQVAFQQWASHLQHLEAEQQRANEARQAETAKQTEERLKTEWNTALEKLPELKDPKKLESFGKDTMKYGVEAYYYTPQELANIHHDHRQLLVLKDAIAWRKLQASKATVQKKVEGRPPITKGGNRLTTGGKNARKATDAITKARASGDINDVTAAFIASLNKG